MYEIRPETAKTFITDRSISLPRFQRKQTWDAKKNFQLCISIFRGYPIGVCIVNTETENKKIKRSLLDGRQRRNALTQLYENPEVIGIWAKAFLKYKKNPEQYDLIELFNEKMDEYLEDDYEESSTQDTESSTQANLSSENGEQEDSESNLDSNEEDENSAIGVVEDGIDLLLQFILLTYKKDKHSTGFTKPFDYAKYFKTLPFIDLNTSNGYVVNGKKVKSFIEEYRTDCENNDIDYTENFDTFADYIISRGTLKDSAKESKIRGDIKDRWKDIVARFEMIEKLDDVMNVCKIGIIEVKGFKPADSQKIFNIINTEGVKLTAAEILSAKTYWNKTINNPSNEMLLAAQELYSNMGIKISDVHRWDVPATILSRLGDNVIFKKLSWDCINKKSEFETKLTLGFKLLSGIYEKGIKKEDIDAMGKNAVIDWDLESEQTIANINSVVQLIEDTAYFKFLKSWRISIMELTSDAIALNFILLMYFDWMRKDRPIGSGTKTKQFQKNSFILWDQLIFEYIKKQWRGSSDSIIATNIKNLDSAGDVFTPVAKDKWSDLLNEILESNTVNEDPVTQQLMKPILYHMYCLKSLAGPGQDCSIEVDHIIPQTDFKSSTLANKSVIQDNLYNFGLLPKKDNISKSSQKLKNIDDPWLISQIKIYEFIDQADFVKFSSVSNYLDLYKFRKTVFDDAFDKCRDNILMN